VSQASRITAVSPNGLFRLGKHLRLEPLPVVGDRADAIRAGEVTESGAQAAARVIATFIDTIKVADLVERVKALEDERKQ
jgi:hypothetical protein